MTDPVVRHYDLLAERYDQRWRAYTAATIAAIAASLNLSGVDRLLDAPCGTGALEEWLKLEHPSVHVTGVDASVAMLRRASAKHKDTDYVWLEADVRRLPFPDASFDRVVCANSIHCLERPLSALAEFKRVLRPGGRLLVLDWCDDFLLCKVCGLWLRWFDQAYRRMFTTNECRLLLQNAGLQVGAWRRFRVGVLWGLMLFDCSLAASPEWDPSASRLKNTGPA